MATAARVHLNPSVLKWARESAGFDLDVAAHRIGVAPERLEEAESGSQLLTYRQARNAAAFYDRPMAALFLPQPPEEPSQEALLRTLPDAPEDPWPPEMVKLVRKIKARQESISDLLEELDEEPTWPQVADSLRSETLESLPRRLREILGIPLSEQVAWSSSDHYLPLRQWVDAVEALGIYVIQDGSVDMSVMRGFVSLHDEVPVIAINSSDDPRARAFTLLHELAHLAGSVISDGGLSESESDQVAAEVVVPRDAAIHYFGLLLAPTPTFGALQSWAATFGITPRAAVVRLSSLGLIDNSESDELMADVNASFTGGRRAGGGDYYRNTLNRAGVAFSGLVLEALDARAISFSAASSLLNVKVNNFEGYRSALSQRSPR